MNLSRKTEKDLILELEKLSARVAELEKYGFVREERFFSLFDKMTEGFALHEIILDEKGVPCDYRFLEVNPAFERLTGLTRDSVVGRAVREALPEIEPYWIETYGAVALTGQPVRFENYSSPLKRHYEVFAYCPAPQQFAVLFMDITERKRAQDQFAQSLDELGSAHEELQVAEEELRQQNEELAIAHRAVEAERLRYQELFDLAPDGYIVTDAKGIIREANRSAAALLNTSQEFLLGKPFLLLLAEGERKSFHIQLAQLARGDRIENWETCLQPRDGELFYASITTARMRDLDGRTTGHRFLIRDITRRKQAEEALRKARDELEMRVQERTKELKEANAALQTEIASRRQAEEAAKGERKRFLDVLETLPAYVVLLTPDYHVPFDNRFFRERFGESHGRRCYEYLFGRTEPCEICETFTVLKTMRPHEWEWLGPDGRNYYIYDFPFVDTDGSTLILEMGIDITEQKQAEEALRNINETLEQRVAERTAALEDAKEIAERRAAELNTVFDSMNDPVLVYDAEGRLLKTNAALRKTVGKNLDGMDREKQAEVFREFAHRHLDGRPMTPEERPVARALRGEAVQAEPYIVTEPTGRENAYEISSSPIVSGRKIIGAVTVSRDITERKRAEAAILRAKEEWETTFDTVPDLMAILDTNHRVVRANQALADRLGVTPQQCVGLRCHEVVHGQDHPPDFCPHTLTCQDGREHHAEVREPRLGGDFLVSTTPLRDAEGTLIGSVHVARDITERKRAEEALRKSREDLNHAQAVAHTGSWRLDVRKDELLWSDESYRVFGIPIGTPLTYETFLAAVHPDDRDYVDRKWKAALRGEPYDIEHRIVVGDTVKWVRERAELEFDEDGALLGGFGTCQDITERKRAEEALRASEARYRRLSESLEETVRQKTAELLQAERLAAIGQMVSTVAHEVRNPIQTIQMGVHTLRKALHDEKERHEILEEIQYGADMLDATISELLEYSRPLKLECSPAPLKDLVEAALKLLKDKVGNIRTHIELERDNEEITVDLVKFTQVLANIISNAADAMPDGGSLRIRSAFSERDGARLLEISITDTGHGIDEKHMGDIYKPFFTTKTRGTGLGIPVCKKVMDAHNGTLSIRSRAGEGTTVELTLPMGS